MNKEINVWDNKKYLIAFARRFIFTSNEEREDFIEDVLMKAHTKLSLFDEDKSNIKTWLCTLSTRHYIDKYIRRKRVERKHIITEEFDYVESINIDLEDFKEHLKSNELLYKFYLLRLEDLSFNKGDEESKKYFICEKLDITTKEYNTLLKKLRDKWNKFNN